MATAPTGPVLSDIEYRALLDLLMASDPWPLEPGADAVLQDLAIREWEARGHDDNSWIVAYHEHGPRRGHDNTHEINPATGVPWPVEPNCCSYHYPRREATT